MGLRSPRLAPETIPRACMGAEIPGGEPEAAWKVLGELAEAMPVAGKKVFPPKSIEDLWRWMMQDHPCFCRFAAIRCTSGRISPPAGSEQRESLFPPTPSLSVEGGGPGGGEFEFPRTPAGRLDLWNRRAFQLFRVHSPGGKKPGAAYAYPGRDQIGLEA